MFEKILGKECFECIKMFGYEDIRCAFCTDKEYYKQYLEEKEEN